MSEETLKDLSYKPGSFPFQSSTAQAILPRLVTEEAAGLTDEEYTRLTTRVLKSLKLKDLPKEERRKLLQRVIDHQKSDLKGDQPRAYDLVFNWMLDRQQGSFCQVRGHSGTGKTHLTKKIEQIQSVTRLIGGESYDMEFCAPTHKAKNVLSKVVDRTARTIYSFLSLRMEEGESEDRDLVDRSRTKDDEFINKNILVQCDEMSMYNEVVVKSLRKKVKQYDMRALLTGDPAQLNPVGEDFSLAFELPGPKIMMKEILRTNNTLTQLSVQIRANNYKFQETEDIHLCDNIKFRKAILDNYDPATCKVAAWRNKTVDAYNSIIRTHLGRGENLEVDDLVCLMGPVLSEFGNQIIANTDDEFLVTDIKIQEARFNSNYDTRMATSEGLYLPAPKDVEVPPLKVKRVELDGRPQDVFLPVDYKAFQEMLSKLAALCRAGEFKWKQWWEIKNAFTGLRYAYSMTVHRLQGSTVPTVFVDVPDILINPDERERQSCLYVAATRPSQSIYLRT